QPLAMTDGFRLALLVSSFFLVAAAALGTRATNTRGEAEPHQVVDGGVSVIRGRRVPAAAISDE
ncbi:MAG: hypothetical protein ACRENL_10595, partial [Candidatus Dormibacteria bacterium]